jgi:hypothetical protein
MAPGGDRLSLEPASGLPEPREGGVRNPTMGKGADLCIGPDRDHREPAPYPASE